MFRQHSTIPLNQIYIHFTTWRNAVKLAKITYTPDLKTIRRVEIMAEIRRVYIENYEESYMSYAKFNQHSPMCIKKVHKYFDTWKNALINADVYYVQDFTAIRSEEIISEIRHIYFKYFKDRQMTSNGFLQHSTLSLGKIRKYFNSWNNALQKARLSNLNSTAFKKREIITEIRRVYFGYFENSRMPISKFMLHSKISTDKVRSYFISWENALKVADVHYNPKLLTSDEKRQNIISDLYRIKDIYEDKFFNFSTYKENKGRYGITEILKLFDCLKWEQLINQKFGITKKFKDRFNKIDYSEKELFEEMKRIWEKLGIRPTKNKFFLNSSISQVIIERKFITWTLFVQEFLSKNEGYNSFLCHKRFGFEVSKNKLIEDLKRVKEINQIHTLSFTNYQQLDGRYKLNHFKKHFGKWSNALESSGLLSSVKRKPKNQLLLNKLQAS